MYRWYLSAAAVRQWLAITGQPDDDGGPIWGAAEQSLADLCDQARDTGRTTESGASIYRVAARIRGRKTRLELTVQTTQRPEGPLPQLVRVRDKGSAR